jgi:dihydroorotate dehydrogenase (NAD+) catalytic subunit
MKMQQDKLQTIIAGLNLKNPTILASGILGVTAKSLKEVMHAGAGAVITKSVSLNARKGYVNPTVIQVEGGLLNAVGLPNPGIYKFKKEIEDLEDLQVPLIVSIFGFSHKEYAKVAEVAVEAGADAIEINLSCPHVKGSGAEIGKDPMMIKNVVKEVKAIVKKPVLVKLTSDVADIKELAEAAVSGGADVITAINTVRAMAIDIETSRPILAHKIGGLSGGVIKPIAVRCVYEIYQVVDVPVIGCGGVRTWNDAIELMLAGASAIQIGSAIAYENLTVFGSVVDGITSYLDKKGYSSVKEIVGLAHKK